MKKVFFYIIIFVIICFSGDSALKYSIGKEIDSQSPYYLSFASIGANLLESRLDCWAKIRTVTTNEETDQALTKILNHLNLPASQSDFLHQENEETMITQYDLQYNDQNYFFLLQTNKADKESYFLMTAINTREDKQIQEDEMKLKEIMDCKSYYSYKGLINARPDYTGQEELLKVVMKNLDAKANDVYRDSKIISMTGFSSKLDLNKNYEVDIDGTKNNVQAAIRSNKEGKTEIYLGFPLLLNDY